MCVSGSDYVVKQHYLVSGVAGLKEPWCADTLRVVPSLYILHHHLGAAIKLYTSRKTSSSCYLSVTSRDIPDNFICSTQQFPPDEHWPGRRGGLPSRTTSPQYSSTHQHEQFLRKRQSRSHKNDKEPLRPVCCTWSQLPTTLYESLDYVALPSRGSLKATEVKHSVAADEMSQYRLRVGQRSGIIWCTPLISGKLTLVHKRLWS